uniref:Uncharacterized protein n=1 Tax=Arundo donax TaxID=35708 RepID=A0A0A9B6X4_ARUDO
MTLTCFCNGLILPIMLQWL